MTALDLKRRLTSGVFFRLSLFTRKEIYAKLMSEYAPGGTYGTNKRFSI